MFQQEIHSQNTHPLTVFLWLHDPPHMWNVLLKDLYPFKIHSKTCWNHLFRKHSRFPTAGHKLSSVASNMSAASSLSLSLKALILHHRSQLLLDIPSLPYWTYHLHLPQISHHVCLRTGTHHKCTALIPNKYTSYRTKLRRTLQILRHSPSLKIPGNFAVYPFLPGKCNFLAHRGRQTLIIFLAYEHFF